MKARISLRWKILLFTVPPLVLLAIAAVWLVERNLTAQADRQLRDDLQRSSALFENMLHARANALATAGAVIVRDPKFFSVLDLPVSPNDPEYRTTVAGVAADFDHITHCDIFEVTDAKGHLLASVGNASTSDQGRAGLVSRALSGASASGLLSEDEGHYQMVVLPVSSGGRVVGALLLGAEVGHALAAELCDLTRSDVTFFAGDRMTGTTLGSEEDRDAAREAVQTLERRRPEVRPDAHLNAIQEFVSAEHTWIALVRPIPGSTPGERHDYVMQRSLDAQTMVLRQVRDRLLLLALLTIAMALLAGVVIAHRLNGPIQRMVRAAEAMERGDYDFPLEVRDRDELGYLATRFDEMRHQQRDLVATLQESARVRREFIAVASHELRTPISVIHGFQEMLVNSAMGPVTDVQRRALEAIGRSVQTLARIAADATRMAQIESDSLELSPSACDARDLLERAAREALASGRGRTVQVMTTIDDEPLHFRADPARLTDAVANLIRNGIRFTPDGGTVQVRAWREDTSLWIEVRDSGVGIAPEKLARLLERHAPVRDSLHHHSSSTLEFNSAGLGLGLTITRGIVAAHGGRLRAESREGHGATFSIELPDAFSSERRLAA